MTVGQDMQPCTVICRPSCFGIATFSADRDPKNADYIASFIYSFLYPSLLVLFLNWDRSWSV